MPQHKSAKKRVHTNLRDQQRNTTVKSELKHLLKKTNQEPTDKEFARLTVSKLDRAVRKGVIAKAVANRRKSRIALAANRTRKAS